MTNRRTIIGLTAAIGAGAAIMAPSAFAHENLAVDTAVSCSGVDYSVTGIDQGTSVSVTRTRTINGVTVTESDSWPYGAPPLHVDLPAGFVGSVSSTITSEGKSDTAGQPLDCRTPPPPPIPPNVTPPPPAPPATCEYLKAHGAGPNAYRRAGYPVNCVERPPRKRRPPVCEAPAKLRIVQQQRGTFFTEVYPLRVIIANTTGAATPAGALVLTDSGLQNFVTPDGSRTEKLVVPVGPMHTGQVRVVDRTMGFTGPEAFRVVFTTYATFHVQGRVCGYTLDKGFEG